MLSRIDYLKPTLKGKVLDIGCNDSPLHELIKKNCKNIDLWGIDVIIDKPSEKTVEASALQMPFKNNEFDFLVAGEIIEHFNQNQAKKFLKECRRVLKSNGELIITTPNKGAWSNRLFHKFDKANAGARIFADGKTFGEHGYHGHQKLYFIDELKKVLEQNEFNIMEFFCLPYTEESSPNQFELIYAIRKIMHCFLSKKLQEEIVIRAKKTPNCSK